MKPQFRRNNNIYAIPVLRNSSYFVKLLASTREKLLKIIYFFTIKLLKIPSFLPPKLLKTIEKN